MSTKKKSTKKAEKPVKAAKAGKQAKAARHAAAPALIPTNSLNHPAILNNQRHFGELQPVSDGPWTQNDSKKYFDSPYYKAEGYTSVPPLNNPNPVVQLADIIGQDAVNKIAANKRTVFHSVGDTGAYTYTTYQNDELPIASLMEKDVVDPNAANRAAFFFHLGDVIYEFGDDEQFYYEQFYEPYRNYNSPIFAIPGNHDGMIHQAKVQPLQPFLNNFCAPAPKPSKDAHGLIRDTMTQPGVYFTLDAPLVSIIGLYSNIADSWPGGIISNYQNMYPKISNVQLDYLAAQLTRLGNLPADQKRAIIIAVHHPPYGTGSKGGSPMLVDDMDKIFSQTGIWPDAVLSGHAHNYQRYTRNAGGREIPYVTAGCGGYNIKPITSPPPNDTKSKVAVDSHAFRFYAPANGYLKISVTPQKLGIAFNSTDPSYGLGADTVVVDLGRHVIISEGKGKPDSLV